MTRRPDDDGAERFLVEGGARIAAAPPSQRAGGPDASRSEARREELAEALLLLERFGTLGREIGGPPPLETAATLSAPSGDSVEEGVRDESADKDAGQWIGRYRIERRLGSGGQGLVFLAYDPELQRRVALKTPYPEALLAPSSRARFLEEARFAARINHPNLVGVYEVGEVGPLCYIASEYCDGPTLSEWLRSRRGPVDAPSAARFLLVLARAVHAMHQCGVLHRDLKPGNILLVRREPSASAAAGGGGEGADPGAWEIEDATPKITDFGLARLVAEGMGRTRSGAVVGTPAYMAPEQALGRIREIRPATDVYSLGAVLYEILAGRRLYGGESEAAALTQVVRGEYKPLRQVRRSIPRDLEAVCHRCLERSPRDRYATASDLADDLERFLLGQPTQARPVSTAQAALRWAKRRPATAALAAVALAALLTISIGAALFSVRLNGALALAEQRAVEAAQSRTAAIREEQRANKHLYAAHMRLANLALNDAALERAEQLLNEHGPGTPTAHLRGFEWRLLRDRTETLKNQGERSKTVVLEHPARTYCVRFSPDERRLVTGCEDGRLRIWDRDGWRLTAAVKAHASCIDSLALSRDARWLATASCDGAATLWSWNDGDIRLERTFADFDDELRGAAFSPDGERLAVGSRKGFVGIYRTATGELERRLSFEGGEASRLAWSPDGSRLAGTINFDLSPVRLWNTNTWEMTRLPVKGSFPAFSPTGQELAVTGGDGIKIATETLATPLSLVAARDVSGAAWSGDGRWLAYLQSRRILHLYDFEHPHSRRVLDVGHRAHAEDVAVTFDGGLVATAADDSVRVTDVRSARENPPLGRIEWGDHDVYDPDGVAVAENAEWALLCSRTRAVVWSLTDPSASREVPLGEGVFSVLPSTLARFAAVVDDADRVRLVDVHRGEVRTAPERLSRGAVKARHFDESDTLAILCQDESDAVLRIVDSRAWSLRRTVTLNGVNDDGKERIAAAVPSFAVSPDAKRLHWRHQSLHQIVFADLAAGDERRLAGRESFSFRFSPDGRRIAAFAPGIVEILEVPSLALVQRFNRPFSFYADGTFSPDQKRFAVWNGVELILYDVASGQETVSIPLPPFDGASVHFTPDGRTLTLIGAKSVTSYEAYQWSPSPMDE